MIKHRICIEWEAFGFGLEVTVLPPPDGVGHDRAFWNTDEARAYAEALGKAMGWPVIDLALAEGEGR